MRDPHYQLAVRLLIGIPPSAHRPPPCSLCGARADLQSDPWHPLHFRFQASHGKSVQHNEVRDLLWNLCRKAGYANVRTEVKDYQATCHSIPDVVVTFDCTTHAIDVSGIDPCAPSHVAQSARHTLSSAHAAMVYDAYQLCQGRASANRANATGRVLPPAGRRDH